MSEVERLLFQHFNINTLHQNAKFYPILDNPTRNLENVRAICSEMFKTSLSTFIMKYNPFTILAVFLGRMSRREDGSNLQFQGRMLGSIEFKEQFIKYLKKAEFPINSSPFTGIPFIAPDNSPTTKFFKKKKAMHIGTDTSRIGHESMNFVARKWVCFAIIKREQPITDQTAERLGLYTWSYKYSNFPTTVTETIVARSCSDLRWFEREMQLEGLIPMSSVGKREVTRKVIVSFNTASSDFHFNQYLYALGTFLANETYGRYDVEFYLWNNKVAREELEAIMRNRGLYQQSFENAREGHNLRLGNEEWSFILSAIGRVDLRDVKYNSEMTLPLGILHANQPFSVQVLSRKKKHTRYLMDLCEWLAPNTTTLRVHEIVNGYGQNV